MFSYKKYQNKGGECNCLNHKGGRIKAKLEGGL